MQMLMIKIKKKIKNQMKIKIILYYIIYTLNIFKKINIIIYLI